MVNLTMALFAKFCVNGPFDEVTLNALDSLVTPVFGVIKELY